MRIFFVLEQAPHAFSLATLPFLCYFLYAILVKAITIAFPSDTEFYVPLGVLLATVLFHRYILHPALLSPLSRIPKAHWSCSISPAWILCARYNGRENRTLHRAHQEHGPVVRVGPSELSVNSLDGVKTIYQGGFDKHEWYSVFENYGVPNVFSASSAKHHSVRKRMVSHVYSKSYIHSSAALAAQASAVLNGRLTSLLEASTTADQAPHGIDVHSLFSAAATDLITAYCFGAARASDFVRNKGYRRHWQALYAARKAGSFFEQELPRLSAAARRCSLGLLPGGLTPAWVGAANREIEDWCRAMSDAALEDLRSGRRVDAADDPVVVRALVAGLEKEERESGAASPVYATAIRHQELTVASETIDHVLAGQETTGVALTYLAYHLSRSPGLQHHLRAELLSLRPSMRLRNSDGGGGGGCGGDMAMPDPKQLDALPILHAVITETVRRYSPAGGPEPRVAPSSSCRIGPYEVPGGTRVSASVYNLHRDERVYPDPERWDHARFLPRDGDGDGDAEERLKSANKHFWGFSSGGRMCLGSNFAMHEMKLIVGAIYSNYTSHVVDDAGIEPTDAYTGHPASNSLYLRFEKVTTDG
ncbi:hypothetical protein DL764_001672 [Monosporascus ibericus]|uniref:Cytochrome P450 n=1 Tax=Monosporascus ibericus TaxID=155417 RepID=A0A4Q4TNF3_9PEZI|nr:hypothetical protein DL764_001672 [Monosporascus ibericus]